MSSFFRIFFTRDFLKQHTVTIMSKRKAEEFAPDIERKSKQAKTTECLTALVFYVDHRRKSRDCSYCSEAGPEDCNCCRETNEIFEFKVQDKMTVDKDEIKNAFISHVCDTWELSDLPKFIIDPEDDEILLEMSADEIWKNLSDPKIEQDDQNWERLFKTVTSAKFFIGVDHGKLMF